MSNFATIPKCDQTNIGISGNCMLRNGLLAASNGTLWGAIGSIMG